jgi:hypothetical protein
MEGSTRAIKIMEESEAQTMESKKDSSKEQENARQEVIEGGPGVSKADQAAGGAGSGQEKNENPQQEPQIRWTQRVRQALIDFSPLITAFATVGIFVATLVYTIYASRQWVTMQQQLELSQRPWVSVDVAARGSLVFDEKGADGGLQFTLRNLGHSPAQYVNLHFDVLPAGGSISGVLVEQKKMCDRMRDLPDNADVKDTILPGGQTVQGRSLRVEKADVEKYTQRHVPVLGPFISLIVFGCADYQFTFAEGHHQTGFMFWIWAYDPLRPQKGTQTIDPSRGTIPAGHIWFQSEAGGTFAN